MGATDTPELGLTALALDWSLGHPVVWLGVLASGRWYYCSSTDPKKASYPTLNHPEHKSIASLMV